MLLNKNKGNNPLPFGASIYTNALFSSSTEMSNAVNVENTMNNDDELASMYLDIGRYVRVISSIVSEEVSADQANYHPSTLQAVLLDILTSVIDIEQISLIYSELTLLLTRDVDLIQSPSGAIWLELVENLAVSMYNTCNVLMLSSDSKNTFLLKSIYVNQIKRSIQVTTELAEHYAAATTNQPVTSIRLFNNVVDYFPYLVMKNIYDDLVQYFDQKNLMIDWNDSDPNKPLAIQMNKELTPVRKSKYSMPERLD